MKTNWRDTFPPDFSQELFHLLEIGIAKNHIKVIWFGAIGQSSTQRGLWVYTQDKTHALFSTIASQTLLREDSIFLIVLDDKDLSYHATIGNSLFKTSLTATNLIYQATSTALPKILYTSLGGFIALYQDKHALLATYCQDLVKQQYRGSSHALLKAFTYDLDVLEIVLLGIKNTTMTLTQRLLLLEQVVPKIKTLFVKSEPNVYYILNDLAQDIQDDVWNSSLQKIQSKLHRIVLHVLDQIDGQTSLIRPRRTIRKTKNKPFKYKEKLLPLLITNQVEELYQFHEILYFQQSKQQKQVYLLVLLKETPTKATKRIIKDIESNQEGLGLTILAHTRLYIQDHVYEFSEFFSSIIQPKNKIYASDYYPQIHWYKSSMRDYSDFILPYKKRLKQINLTLEQDFTNPKKETYITTHHLHVCLAVKLKIYILHHLHYVPQTNSIHSLLYLALYAQDKEAPSLKSLYDILYPLVFDYTIRHKQEKKYNLVLDITLVKQIRQFFTTLEV
ncbi:hypothetical protein [Myroides fluvii]|uniref:hypothetical protein n=1 Tax=Myroides fluvii TaxID=2572594 RepID=UPI00131AB97E|nr:hypothetical protein [Myroides fluvii]